MRGRLRARRRCATRDAGTARAVESRLLGTPAGDRKSPRAALRPAVVCVALSAAIVRSEDDMRRVVGLTDDLVRAADDLGELVGTPDDFRGGCVMHGLLWASACS